MKASQTINNLKPKTYLSIITLFITFLFITSCSKKDDSNNCIEHTISECNEDSTKVNIRITNISDNVFCNVVLIDMNCGIIEQNQSSCYRAFESGYNYSFIELEIDGNTYTIQPIDFVGETPLENGYYTYQINTNDSNQQYEKLTLTFVED
ncbi:hypothetical protein [Olleya namhaensis]|uniref:Uncharacterized protein n=1 Tax=Olleya namhaensis TaxID=1144750 RepID=A0A1I3PM72_9FLAO|nr:hypothetical protein [Olleya namhaensis]SFJ22583.1 hypothetical protein SAMN05443431_105179 [Olleya namhaensis]